MTGGPESVIDPAQFERAAGAVAMRFRDRGGTLRDHAAAIAGAGPGGGAAPDALVAELEARARALLAAAPAHGDPVELSSIDSFPASDPPSWIARGPAEREAR